MNWRVLSASVPGSEHLRRDLPCQDTCLHHRWQREDGQSGLLCVLADGAGSASHAREGAEAACEAVRAFVINRLLSVPAASFSQEDGAECLEAVRNELMQQAQILGCESTDLACTLLVAVCTPEHCFFLQVGDGAMVFRRGEVTGLVFELEPGMYVNETHFVTSPDAHAHLHARMVPGGMGGLALFSDGLQALAVHLNTQTPHPAFFAPFWEAVSVTQYDEAKMSASLAAWLRSPALDERTGDDKTLVVACHDRVDI